MPSSYDIQRQQVMIIDALENDSDADICYLIEPLRAVDIARMIESIPAEHRLKIWFCLSAEKMAEVLLNTHGELRRYLARNSETAVLIESLSNMQADELADLDSDLPSEMVNAMVASMDEQRRQRYRAVKDYPDDSAGGLMDADAIAVRADVSLRSVLRYLRQIHRREGKLSEHLDSLMVVDRKNQFKGVLPLSRLVALEPSLTVKEAMVEGDTAMTALTPAYKVSRIFEDEDLLSAPVVDESGVLLGRITVDDVIDVMREQSDRELYGRAGLQRHPDLFAPVLPSSMRRAVWLGVNLATAFLAAWVIGLFQASIDQLVALAVLMPVVASMGGAAGNQTLTLVTRAAALDQIGRNNLWKLTRNEVLIGLFNGLLWALLVTFVAAIWFENWLLGTVFGTSLLLAIVTGALAGVLLPLVLRALGVDPALAGGVVLTTVTDVVAFFAFLGISTLVLL
ncbi:magnesium transporter [Motiliproteus sp.]|uniref:magnesium transporter n=1 Tax=Motiliproteus sp. TaxID=1898955 RepID=UPI003BAC043E